MADTIETVPSEQTAPEPIKREPDTAEKGAEETKVEQPAKDSEVPTENIDTTIPSEEAPKEEETPKAEEDAPTEPEVNEAEPEPAEEAEVVAEPEPEPEEIIEIPSGNGELVLVTGATGYLGSNIVKLLIESGEFKVRGTVRTIDGNEKLGKLKDLLAEANEQPEFVEADLVKAESWDEAVKGCDYVIHVASPYPTDDPADANEIIEPAKQGTLSILKAAAASGTVRRVVLTSSLSAVSGGHNGADKNAMNEAIWADLDKVAGAYDKSKAIAEKAAWDYMEKELPEGCSMELSVVNPGFCVGPPLTNTEGTSMELIKKLMTREYDQLPKLNYSVIDVRDAAVCHIRAMMIKQAAGQRHLICRPPIWLKDMANILSQEFSSKGWNVSTTQVPYIAVWIKSHFKNHQDLKKILPYVGKVYNFDTKRMQKILQVEPRDVRESIVEMAQAMIELGIVTKVEKAEKKPKRFTIRKQRKTPEAEEEKKDTPEKKDEAASEGDQTEEVEAAKAEDVDVSVEPTTEESTEVKTAVEPAAEATAEEPEITAAPETTEKSEESVPSDEEKKEEATTSDPESSKKKDKKPKEKKEKKKGGLFSFSFKKDKTKKPTVEKKASTDTEEPKEEAAATETATEETAAQAQENPTVEITPAEEPAAASEAAPDVGEATPAEQAETEQTSESTTQANQENVTEAEAAGVAESTPAESEESKPAEEVKPEESVPASTEPESTEPASSE